jgi:uncharacterized membrane protein
VSDSGTGGQVPERSQPNNPAIPQEPQGRVVARYERHFQQVTVQVPFPPPELLAGYKELGIEPQKLLDMVEAQAQRRSDFERDLLRMEDGDRIEKNRTARRGQTLGFTLGVLAIIALVICFFVAPQQAAEVAKLVGPAGITGLVLALLGVRWISKKQVNAEHDNEMVKLRGEVERIKRTLQGGPPA